MKPGFRIGPIEFSPEDRRETGSELREKNGLTSIYWRSIKGAIDDPPRGYRVLPTHSQWVLGDLPKKHNPTPLRRPVFSLINGVFSLSGSDLFAYLQALAGMNHGGVESVPTL